MRSSTSLVLASPAKTSINVTVPGSLSMRCCNLGPRNDLKAVVFKPYRFAMRSAREFGLLLVGFDEIDSCVSRCSSATQH